MKPRPFILFDVMDTLVVDPVYELLPKLTGLPIAEVWASVTPGAWPRFERGEIPEADYLRRFFADGRGIDGAALKAGLRDGYRWVDGAQELLAELKADGVEMHILSNYPRWYEVVEARLGLSRFLPWTFVSCETGRRKPEPEAFLGAAAALQRPPQLGFFVDDRESNCAAARALGFQAHRFATTAELRSALHAWRVEVEA